MSEEFKDDKVDDATETRGKLKCPCCKQTKQCESIEEYQELVATIKAYHKELRQKDKEKAEQIRTNIKAQKIKTVQCVMCTKGKTKQGEVCSICNGTGKIKDIVPVRYDSKLAIERREKAFELIRQGVSPRVIQQKLGWKNVGSVYQVRDYYKRRGML